jgi:hypothetical protein
MFVNSCLTICNVAKTYLCVKRLFEIKRFDACFVFAIFKGHYGAGLLLQSWFYINLNVQPQSGSCYLLTYIQGS